MPTPSSAKGPGGLTLQIDQDGDRLAVRATGELDIGTNDVLEKELLDAFESRAASIVLDLEGVTFIDSTGLRLLLWATIRSRENGDRLRIHCGAGAVRPLLELTKLDRLLPLAG